MIKPLLYNVRVAAFGAENNKTEGPRTLKEAEMYHSRPNRENVASGFQYLGEYPAQAINIQDEKGNRYTVYDFLVKDKSENEYWARSGRSYDGKRTLYYDKETLSRIIDSEKTMFQLNNLPKGVKTHRSTDSWFISLPKGKKLPDKVISALHTNWYGDIIPNNNLNLEIKEILKLNKDKKISYFAITSREALGSVRDAFIKHFKK